MLLGLPLLTGAVPARACGRAAGRVAFAGRRPDAALAERLRAEALAEAGAGVAAVRAAFFGARFGALAVRLAAFLGLPAVALLAEAGAAFFVAVRLADLAFAFFAGFFRAMSRSFRLP
jgi:hypothetical protein